MDYLALKMKDLESPEDVSFLVDVFYKKILEDETLSPFFAHIDFKKHKPRMEHFWNFVLYQDQKLQIAVVSRFVNAKLSTYRIRLNATPGFYFSLWVFR